VSGVDSAVVIRPARPDDVPRIREVERAAGALFAGVGLPEIAADPPTPADRLLSLLAADRLLVAALSDVVGYVQLEIVDGRAHVAELGVHPSVGRRGIGTLLLAAADGWADARGLREVSLTTFREVPFNAPFYRRRGFVDLPADRQGPGVRAIVVAEQARGLSARDRVVLVRSVRPPGR
jgi:GNAT superfamily N-acetyltransferase